MYPFERNITKENDVAEGYRQTEWNGAVWQGVINKKTILWLLSVWLIGLKTRKMFFHLLFFKLRQWHRNMFKMWKSKNLKNLCICYEDLLFLSNMFPARLSFDSQNASWHFIMKPLFWQCPIKPWIYITQPITLSDLFISKTVAAKKKVASFKHTHKTDEIDLPPQQSVPPFKMRHL